MPEYWHQLDKTSSLDKRSGFRDYFAMANEDQAQADLQTETTVADPLDAVKSQSGTNELAAYQAEKEAMLNSLDNDDEQGHESADVEEEEEEQADDTVSDEEAEEQSEEVSDEEEADEDEPEPEAKAKDRFRFKNADDQAVAAIAKAKGISLVEAARLYAGDPSTTKHQEAAQEKSQEAVETVASVQARLEELEDLEATASSALEFETANEHRREANKLRNKLMDLKIAEVQSKANAEQAEAAKFYADYEKSEIKTVGLYPDAAVKTSPLAKEMARLEAEMLELGDPLYHSTDKPFILAKEAAKNLGIPMKKPGTAPVKKTVQHRPIQPAGGNARTTSTDANQALEQEIDQLDSLEAYERKFRQR